MAKKKCPTCEKTFITQKSLKQHLKIHKSEVTYNCSQCEQQFQLKSLFDNHLQTHVGSLKCPKCENTYQTKQSQR